MKKRITEVLIILALIAFASIGIVNIRTNHQQIQIDRVRLQDNTAKLKLLNEKYQNLNLQLDQTGADKAKLEQQLQQLEQEKAKLERDLALKKLTVSNVAYAESGPIESDDYYVNWIIQHESGGNPNAVNSSSGACGLFQKLPCNVTLGDVEGQMADGLAYIQHRYGSPYNAWLFWQKNGWY